MMKVRVSNVSQSASSVVRSSLAHTPLSSTLRSTTAPREHRIPSKSVSSTTLVAPSSLTLFAKCNFHSSKRTQDEAATSHTANSSTSSSTKPQPPRHSDVSSTNVNNGDHRVNMNNVNIVQLEQHIEGIATVETPALSVSSDIKPPALTSTSVSEAHFQHGFHLYEAGRIDDAVKALELAVQYNAEHGPAHHYLGVTYASGNQHQRAITHFLKSTKLGPQDSKLVQESWYQLGQSYIALGQYKDVVAAMDKMIKVNSNDKSVHYNRGYALMMLEIFDYAVRCFDVALYLDPKHLAALQCKAFCFIQQKKYSQALELLDSALQINPKDETTLSYVKFARKHFLRQRGVYPFEEVFPTSAERRQQLPARFRRTLLTSVLLRPS